MCLEKSPWINLGRYLLIKNLNTCILCSLNLKKSNIMFVLDYTFLNAELKDWKVRASNFEVRFTKLNLKK